ncbi:MAG: helix-turn-helix domain-containing protein [Firmicutes bacterium]|nr:helix-turn-helix domain-containing protein [Bacillota bacterium]
MEGEDYAARKEQDLEPAFDAIIPAPVRYNDALRPNAKLMYGEIRALCRTRGYCWASNSYFAKLYGMNERSIARFIAQLEELKLIRIVILRDDNGRVCGRRIYIVFPFETEEDDTSLNMTKKSATRPKSQGEGDQNVSQSLNNNIKNNKYARAKKSTDIAAVKEELKHWVDGLSLPTQETADLMERLSDFADMRREIGSPMATGRCVKILVNGLQRHSGGNVAVMIAMLDKAIFRRWASVYQLREDELREALGKGSPTSSDDEEDIPWLE